MSQYECGKFLAGESGIFVLDDPIGHRVDLFAKSGKHFYNWRADYNSPPTLGISGAETNGKSLCSTYSKSLESYYGSIYATAAITLMIKL